MPPRHQSDVERVFQGLIEVFNNNARSWDQVHCHVLYDAVPKYAVPQTEALMEVAQLYGIPIQVQWQPLDESKRARGTWTRVTSQQPQGSDPESAMEAAPPSLSSRKRFFPNNTPRLGSKRVGKGGRKGAFPVEDHSTTAATTECEGSSGCLLPN